MNATDKSDGILWTTSSMASLVTTTATTKTTATMDTPPEHEHLAATITIVGVNNTNDSIDSLGVINNEFVQIFFCVLYSTVFVLGVFGNVLVCYVVLRNRAMQTVTNIFITNLALSDILLCVLAVPFTPLYTFMGRWAFGRTLCHLVSFAQGCSIYISTLTLTSIAIDRYFVIIYPFHPRMKLSTCIAIIFSIWIVSLLATLPYGMYMKVVSEVSAFANETASISMLGGNLTTWANGHNSSIPSTVNPYTSLVPIDNAMRTASSESHVAYTYTYSPSATSYCEENWPSEQYRKVFGCMTTILQFILPFIIISICYTWVSIKLNARAKAKPGSKSSRREEADRDRKKRTNRMLISMVAVFGLSWLPINVVNIFDDFYEKSHEWRFYTLFFFVAHSIAMSSTCYNPFLYAWLNDNFRKEFKHVLPCFNPSNNNIINLTRGYNRSDRNTCGPRLRDGDDGDDNGLMFTQDTCIAIGAEGNEKKDVLMIIPREATYSNGAGGNIGINTKSIDIMLNDDPLRNDNDSVEERQVEMRFCETPFLSSDNNIGISTLEISSAATDRTNVSSISN